LCFHRYLGNGTSIGAYCYYGSLTGSPYRLTDSDQIRRDNPGGGLTENAGTGECGEK